MKYMHGMFQQEASYMYNCNSHYTLATLVLTVVSANLMGSKPVHKWSPLGIHVPLLVTCCLFH